MVHVQLQDRSLSFLILEKCIKSTFEGGMCQLCYITKYEHLPEVKKTHEEKIT